MKRKAQFSTYLKPIIVIIFALLLIFLLQRVLSFQMFVDEEVERADFMDSINTNFIGITRCLRVDDPTALYTLDSDELFLYNNTYENREPPCAEDFNYGYSVRVEHECLDDIGDLPSGECEPEVYEFGALEGSTGSSLHGKLSTSFPVNIEIDEEEGLRVPGELEITMRDGDLEELAGKLNRVVENQGEETVRFDTEQRICSSGNKICIGQEENCIELRENLESDFTLSPGSYYLEIDYTLGGNIEIDGGAENGC